MTRPIANSAARVAAIENPSGHIALYAGSLQRLAEIHAEPDSAEKTARIESVAASIARQWFRMTDGERAQIQAVS